MRLGMISYPITCLGPGKRVGLWVRGCPRNCPGCISPTFQSFDDAYQMPWEEVLRKIHDKSPSDLRITISGGEPFLQDDLLPLLRKLREEGYYDIMVYSGFTYEELMQDEKKAKCLKYIDVLVDGPYVEALNDDLPLRGSSNQRVIFLNGALEKDYLASLRGERKFQIEYLRDGVVNFYGIPQKGFDLAILRKKDEE